MILQGVLRKLCFESGKSIVIVDQIPAKGKESKEDNEIGRVLPMTASGLEYFVDLMVEISLQEREGEIVRVFQVVKSNSPAFVVGFELVGNVTFSDFLNHLRRENGTDLPLESPKPLSVSETLTDSGLSEETLNAAPEFTIQDLIDKATQNGFKQADLVTAARVYHNQPNLYRLSQEQLLDLDKRLTAKIEKTRGDAGLTRASGETAAPKAKSKAK
jgi:hypothetical protein